MRLEAVFEFPRGTLVGSVTIWCRLVPYDVPAGQCYGTMQSISAPGTKRRPSVPGAIKEQQLPQHVLPRHEIDSASEGTHPPGAMKALPLLLTQSFTSACMSLACR